MLSQVHIMNILCKNQDAVVTVAVFCYVVKFMKN